MPNLKRQLNSRSPSPGDAYTDANKLPNIDLSDNSRRLSSQQKVPNTTAGNSSGVDDIMSKLPNIDLSDNSRRLSSQQKVPNTTAGNSSGVDDIMSNMSSVKLTTPQPVQMT